MIYYKNLFKLQGATSSREPLLTSSSTTTGTGSAQTPDDDDDNNVYNKPPPFDMLPKLPGVIPVSGHNISTGWLQRQLYHY